MRRSAPVAVVFLLSVSAWGDAGSGLPDERAERDFRPAYLDRATGRPPKPRQFTNPSPWPVQLLSIGHTIGSFQNYGGGPGESYFHHGLDLRAPAGSAVTASRGGRVVNIENYVPGNALYWEVAVQDDDGLIWQYHHVESRSIPASVREAFRTGARIAAGDALGAVVRWPVESFGERYDHIHLNVVGEGRAYLDPSGFLRPLDDSAAPEVAEIFLQQGGKAVPQARASGSYTLAARVCDLILSRSYCVPPHAIQISIDGGPLLPVWRFDTLPGRSSTTRFVNDFYVPSRTCGNYSCRRLVLDLGFTVEGRRSFPKEPGEHRVLVEVQDRAGNSATKEFRWTVEPPDKMPRPALESLSAGGPAFD